MEPGAGRTVSTNNRDWINHNLQLPLAKMAKTVLHLKMRKKN